MALSMSISAGKHNARHNTDLAYRAKLPNVDPRLSRLNLTIKDEPIGKAYDRIFGKSLSDYNAKQKSKGHGERCIADYHAKIEGAWKADSAKVDSHKKGRSNVPKPCYEYVLQLGDRDTFRKELDYETAKEIFEEAVSGIEEKTEGAIDWFQIVLHFDEPNGTWHGHMAGIPYGDGNKRDNRGCNQPTAKKVRCAETGNQFVSLSDAARAVGLRNGNSIRRAIDRGGTAGGYHWEYLDEKKEVSTDDHHQADGRAE